MAEVQSFHFFVTLRIFPKARIFAALPCSEATPRGRRQRALRRLRMQQRGKLHRIGKEVDRLDEDEGASLVRDRPAEYERDDLANDIDDLSQFPQRAVAAEIAISKRRWRDIAGVVRGRGIERQRGSRRSQASAVITVADLWAEVAPDPWRFGYLAGT
jgi:hypothetical protein